MDEDSFQFEYVIGIDPGVTGAVAVLNAKTDELDVYDMPIEKINEKNLLSIERLAYLLKEVCIKRNCIVILEKQGPRPKQGTVSTFNIGAQYGAICGIIATLDLYSITATPQAWKKCYEEFETLKTDTNDSKKIARAIASLRFPEQIKKFRRVKDHGRADASLIAGAWTALLPTSDKKEES